MSDGYHELVERGTKSVPVWDVGGDVVVTAAQVLNEGVTAGNGAGCPVLFEAAHRSESGFESTVVRFDRIVRVLLDRVPRGRCQLVDDARVEPGLVGGDLDRHGAQTESPTENDRAAVRSRFADNSTSMT